MGVQEYDTIAGNNTTINGIAVTGSSSIKNGDNALRQLMSDTATGIRDGSYMANGYVAKAAGYTVVAADRGKIIDCTAALTLSLTAAATVGAGFVFIVKANGGAVTVDPNGTENINGASTSLVIPDGAFAVIACTGAAWNALVAGNVTKTGTETLTNKTLTSPVITGADPWSFQPIGVPIPLLDNIAGTAAPPTDKAYRYVKLTASSAYNTGGVLTSESVSGTAPLVVATAVVSLAGSPIDGQTINLINTERRFLRAGSPGTLENDQMQGHYHDLPVDGSSTADTSPSGSYYKRANSAAGDVKATTIETDGTNGTPRVGNENRSKNIGATYFMRIK